MLHFVRAPRRASWSPTEVAGPIEGYTLRECHVLFLLAPLPEVMRDALLGWLLDPTDLRRWQPPSSFSSHRFPFAEREVQNKSRDDYTTLLREELKVIRQTLDFPDQALSGLTRYGLLLAHGIRLRQLAWAMWPTVTAREIARIVA